MNDFIQIINSSFSNNINDYNFINYPRRIEKKYYLELREKISAELIKINGILSVYSMGNVGAPGISDLDFLLVVKDGFTNKKEIENYFHNLSEIDKYIAFVHYPFIAFESNTSDILKILPLSNLNFLSGNKQKLEYKISKEENIEILRELLFLFYPNIFLNYLLFKTIDIRTAIQVLNALRFPLEFVLNYEYFEEFDKYIFDLDELKKNWFNFNKDELYINILLLIKEAVNICYKLIDHVNSKNLNILSKKNIVLDKFNLILLNNYDADKSLKYTISIFKKTKRIVKFLPISFLYSYMTFSNINNVLKNSININDEFLFNRKRLYKIYSDKLVQSELNYIVPFPYQYRNKKSSFIKKMILNTINFFYK